MTVATRIAAIGLTAWALSSGAAVAAPAAASPMAVFAPPNGIGFSFEWDDDDDDWDNTATWECPTGCSVVWEEDFLGPPG
jgi:hypothetical protein